MSDVYDMHSFTLNIHNGYDDRNDPLDPTPTPKTGFIESKQKVTVNNKGENVLSAGNIRIDFDDTITLEDTVTIGSDNRNIINITHERDFSNKKTVLWLR
jgi:hypothetical protein